MAAAVLIEANAICETKLTTASMDFAAKSLTAPDLAAFIRVRTEPAPGKLMAPVPKLEKAGLVAEASRMHS